MLAKIVLRATKEFVVLWYSLTCDCQSNMSLHVVLETCSMRQPRSHDGRNFACSSIAFSSGWDVAVSAGASSTAAWDLTADNCRVLPEPGSICDLLGKAFSIVTANQASVIQRRFSPQDKGYDCSYMGDIVTITSTQEPPSCHAMDFIALCEAFT